MSTLEKSRPPILNRLLAALPPKEYQRLRPHLEPATLTLKQVLYREGASAESVWFPQQGMISLVSVLESGRAIEIGIVGSEGMVGTATFMGGQAPCEAMVQLAGSALRMKAGVLSREFKRGGALQDLLLHYAQALYVQVSQTAACNGSHKLDQRLARWLLMTHDRAGADSIELTQEFIAMMLGVERSGVTLASITLQDAGLVKYSRGKITILNRKKLESASCECYRRVRKYFDTSLRPEQA
jgi:CRP-like cAMP-binding protein